MKKIALVLSALVMCAALISCASKKEETVEQPAEQSVETAAPAEETAVPVQQSGAWQENSMSNTAQCGYFFTSRELGPLGTVEAVFKKDSGYEHGGFGFAFGYEPAPGGYIQDFIRLDITTSGHYALYSLKGGVYTDLVETQPANEAYLYASSAVKKGNGGENTLKVEKKDDGTFTCYINGQKIAEKLEAPVEGGSGICALFSVGSESQEQFPDNPVKVSFKVK